MGAELFHANRRTDVQTDGETDTIKLIVTLRNVAILRMRLNFSVHANLQISPVHFRKPIKIKEMSIKTAVSASQQTKSEPQRQTTKCSVGRV